MKFIQKLIESSNPSETIIHRLTKLSESEKNSLTEASDKKVTVKDLVKLFKNTSDWGDMKDYVWGKGNVLEVVDTWYYGGDKALKSLISEWTSPNGTYAKHFKNELGITFKLKDSFKDIKASGKHKKLTTDGIVGIFLEIN